MQAKSMEAKLEKAKRKRQTFRMLYTKLESKVTDYLKEEVTELDELKVMEQQVTEKQSLLEQVNKDVENLIDDFEELDNDIQKSQEYSDNLIRIKIKLKSAIESKRGETALNVSNAIENVKTNVNINLPKFDLPSFSGDLAEWLSFKQIFLTSINECESLTNLQKLQYLKAALIGSAAKLIKGFPITDSSYKEAWDTLAARYDNKKELAYAELNKFFNTKPVKPDSRRSILDLLDSSNEAIRNLKCLNFELNSFVELILVHSIQAKLNTNLRRQWDLSSEGDTIPTYDQIIAFLEKNARSLQDINEVCGKVDYKQRGGVKKSVTNAGVTKSEMILLQACPECKEQHPLHKCQQFGKKPVEERWAFVKKQNLCVNCLRSNHFVSKCLITSKCKVCGRKHHTLLHSENNSFLNLLPAAQNSVKPLAKTEVSLATDTSCLSSQTDCHTLLSTAVINVKSFKGDFIACRAIVDSGSQNTLISQDCCQKLGLSMTVTNHRIFGLNNVIAETSLNKVKLLFTPHFNNQQFSVDALVVSNVTVNLPNFVLKRTSWPHIEGLNLADPYFHVSTPIDILIGADLFPLIIHGHCVLGPKGTPSAINSKLGWLLSGVVQSSNSVSRHKNSFTCHAITQLNQDLQKFWEFESVPNVTNSVHSSEQLYQKTITRNEEGRYVVELPFKEHPVLGNSENNALKRFQRLAIRTLRQLSTDYSKFPNAARVINENFYVDDLLAGTQSIEEAESLIKELVCVLKKGGFTLRKWASNHPSVLNNIPEQFKSSKSSVCLNENQSLKILGIIWNSSNDILQIHIGPFKPVNTKRELLSTIARIFDPLGLLSPSTIVLKIMMQELWKETLSWDDPIPSSTLNVWMEFSSQIELLKSVSICRKLKAVDHSNVRTQLHGFCDGSGKAHASVIYLRMISDSNEVSTSFIAAKTRVNPIKHVTSPRIELSAALLLAQLCATVLETLPKIANEMYLWSDSEIVLNWIYSPPSKGNQFVTNRVSRIKALVPQATWGHISSSSNPADCASRGILPKRLLTYDTWFNGPDWLYSNQVIFPAFKIQKVLPTSTEVTSHMSISPKSNLPNFLLKFSSFVKLYRVISFCKRFIYNSKQPSARITEALSSEELAESIKCIVRIIQETEFPTELKLLKRNQPLPSHCKYIPLNIFLDSEGLIRVGGRLSQHQSLNKDQKHPMILPKNNHITNLIIRHFHLKTFHGGPQLVLSLIRQQFWFVDGRSTVRKIINKCLLCKKLKAQTCQQLMGDLPEHRITPIRPFLKSGLDFAGPFLTKPNLTRSKVKIKSYICVFICMCTKAVHLEAVSDLTSQAFLAALKRFIARRGLPSDLFSDNGKNFKGLSNQLQELFRIVKSEKVQDFVSNHLIKWHFIPPYSPHFGGLWESAIKLVKNHLVKACKSTLLNFEELATLLCQIEACVNSRPLIPMSSDPSDPRALTPGHFLIGAPLLDIAESPPTATLNLSARWQIVQETKLHFWRRWSRDYLHHLQQRPKWCSSKTDVKVGDLVVIHDSQAPPLQWKLGRVAAVFPGPDARVRVVDVKTDSGVIKRPICKITVLLSGREDVRF